MPDGDPDIIILKWARRSVQVDLTRVTHITVKDKWVTFHDHEDPIEVRRTLNEVKDMLPPGRFAQISRSALVNRRCILEVRRSDRELILRGSKKTLPVTTFGELEAFGYVESPG